MPINTTLSTNPLKRTREEKGKSLIEFPEDYCVVDIETTGFSPEWDTIIEIGALTVSYTHLDVYKRQA